MKHYFNCLKKYATFSGRASRSEYWMFVLINIIIFIIYILLSMGILLFFDKVLESTYDTNGIIVDIIIGGIYIYFLFLIIPSISVFVRRMHDAGQSGWCFFLRFIPLIGPFITLAFLLTKSDEGENKYGKNPNDIIETENETTEK